MSTVQWDDIPKYYNIYAVYNDGTGEFYKDYQEFIETRKQDLGYQFHYRPLPLDIDQKESVIRGQIGGTHYKKMGDYQPYIVLTHWMTSEELKGFAKGSAISYLAREADKGGRQDIEKAIHHLQLYLELSK